MPYAYPGQTIVGPPGRRRVVGVPLFPDLGASLLARWDAASGITQSGGAVSAWTDMVAGYVMAQGTAANQPTYQATGYRGAPAIMFDGTTDFLNMESQPFPSGNAGSELWVLATLAAGGAVRRAVMYGGSLSQTSRAIRTSALDSFVAEAGDGTTAANATGDTGVAVGAHVIRATFGGTITLTVDGGTTVSAANTSATGTTRIRIGSATGTSPGSFWNGQMIAIYITAPLTAGQAQQLTAHLMNRRG